MVKNEAHNIVQTLKPLVNAGIKHFVIWDTGSIDNSPQLIKNFFGHHPEIAVRFGQEQFIDFATSRNHALDFAYKEFPCATFMLMPDAEWYLHDDHGNLMKFCEQHACA